jgi:[CysO sulfur-carrier protein]-S-L-cysteine hydrolase
VVIPPEIRAELRTHALEEAPNECCGLVLVKDDVAISYIRGINKLASPYRYELYIDPFVWSEIDDELEQVIFHSHPETQPIPSRTDRERAGLWAGKPFLIYGVASDELRGWRVERDSAEELELQ